MSKNAVVVLAVIILLVLGGWYYLQSKKSSNNQQVSTPQTSTETMSASPSESASPSGMMSKNVVKITASGFNPQNMTIKAGESVEWMNDDSENHTVNSAPHPTHTAYSLLNLGVIKPGESKSLTFPTAGTYKYHDHLNPSLTGSITVQ